MDEELHNLCFGEMTTEELVTRTRKLVEDTGIGRLLHASTRKDPDAARKKVLGAAVSKVAPSSAGYLTQFGVRKLLLLLFKHRAEHGSRVDCWAALTIGQLRLMSADEGEFLDGVPPSWSAR